MSASQKGTQGGTQGPQGDASQLAYDPDQDVNQKREIRMQYRNLIGEQKGSFSFSKNALDATDLLLG
jgi:hypothetical protein